MTEGNYDNCIVLCTGGLYYCCTAQDSLNGDQLTDQFKAYLEQRS